MIHELSDSVPELPPYDVVIVGTGPAGVTVAHELRGAGLRVCLLESGRRRPSRWGDGLRKVVSRGITIKDYSRERVLGGTSTTWSGLSSPLDPIDFAPRPWLAHSGWPVPRDALLPYWRAAAARYRFAPLRLFAPGGFDALKSAGDVVPEWSALDEKVFLAAAEPQDFGREFLPFLEGPEVDVLLDATVVRLGRDDAPGHAHDADAHPGSVGAPRADADLPRVACAEVRSSNGTRRLVRGRVFVLAAGGLENARLLLQSRDVCPAGLGNERDVVGRFLMNHPKSYAGTIRLARPVRELPWLFGCLSAGYAGYAGLRLREDTQAERGVLNSYVRFEPVFPWTDNPGVESLVLLVKRSRVVLGAIRRRGEQKTVTLRDYSETGDDSDRQNERKTFLGWCAVLGNVVLHMGSVLRYAVARVRAQAPLVKSVRVRNFMEMEPDPENRVLLGGATDPLGHPITVVRHDSSALDRRSLVALHEVLAEELRRNGFGELHGDLEHAEPWPVTQDASHHMGTTRMGDDPDTSVVDRNLRLHTVANVYAAGASVFPTSGCANPTFTLVALSIRLAQHLRTDVFGCAPAQAGRGEDVPGVSSVSSAGDADGDADDAAHVPAATWVVGADDAPDGRRRVHVVGAGGRVATDVLPAFASLGDRYALAGLWATSARTLVAGGCAYAVRPLGLLDAQTLRAGDLVYVAVDKNAVPKVLARLAAVRSADVDLLLDTPVLPFKHLGRLAALAAFRNTWVAEDCSTLPWLAAVDGARATLGELRAVRFVRGAYRYHAFALMKTLLGAQRVTRARRRRAGGGAEVSLRFANGATAWMSEPRDYATGRVELHFARGVVSDRPDEVPGALPLTMRVDGERCTGFACAGATTELDAAESALLGPVRAGAAVTSHTDRLKIVGLRRMLAHIVAGGAGYPLLEGVDDMALDFWLDRLGRWIHNPVLSLRSPLGRRLVPGVLRVVTGG